MMLTVGNQRSYSDVCQLTGGKIRKASNAVIDVDDGLLHVDAGVTLQQVMQVIGPAGASLPVMPGTQYATIGGCIANDVHGKNHTRDGAFGHHVSRIGLKRTDGDWTLNLGDELFSATFGGLGLTGTIMWADIKLRDRRIFKPWLFPLDYTPYWRIVKRFGLKQYQCVVPSNAIPILKHCMPQPLLASKKEFGAIPSVGMLSFCRPGVALALDYLPDTKTSVLDNIVIDYGGAVNPAKTSMSQAMFRHSFPRWKEFSQFVDPSYSSDFWQRVNSPP